MKSFRWQLLVLVPMLSSLCFPSWAGVKPSISDLNPSSAAPGGPQFTLAVYGSGFAAGARVNWGNTELATTFVGATQLTAIVPASLTAAAGTAEVTVITGGSRSNSIVFTIASGWFENFESYPSGSFPSPDWQPSGNNGTSIVNTEHVFSTQSAQLYGEVGACWAALDFRPIPVTPPFTIEYFTRNGNESLSGCHPNRSDLQIATAATWTSGLRDLAFFDANGDFLTKVGGSGPRYPLLTWVKVRVTYERPNADTVRIGYWLNDQFYKSVNVTAETYEDQLAWLALQSEEGTSWFDNVSITAGMPLVPSLNVAISHRGEFEQGQSGVTYDLAVSNAEGAAPSIGTTSVSENVPAGLTLSSMAGTGWMCGNRTCSRSDQLAAGASFPPITATFDVAWNAPATITNKAGVSGGGSKPANATDLTTIETDNPVPALTSISPAGTKAGGNAFNLTVNGSNFVETSEVRWNGSATSTAFVSVNELRATIPKTDIASVGTALITVSNPSPGGGTSKPLAFGVKGPPPAPVFKPASGTYASATRVTITDVAPGATIYYAINPTSITSFSTYTEPIVVSESETLEAFAIVSGYNPSPTATAEYVVQSPTVKLSANSVAFGNQAIGTISTAHIVLLTNNGKSVVSIKSIKLAGPDASSFLMDQTCSAQLPSGASCKISLFFYPSASGAANAYVTIIDNASGSPQKVTLTGTGK